MDVERLLQRFLRYVAINTTANDNTDDYPSSPGQWELGRLLVAELRDCGADQVEQNAHGLVLATFEANVAGDIPVIAFNAHLDTSPEMPGHNIRPQIIRHYAGGDLRLPGNSEAIIRVAENRELDDLLGCTLITTDGTTLLGADDKAGIAIIMELVAHLAEHREIPHGPLRILFTCDEEIGRGVQHVSLAELGADIAYTIDGPAAGHIDVETFSADLATITFRGINIHPAIAYERMINAVKAAATFVSLLPRDRLAPESTRERDGFVHPYTIEGGVAQVQLKVLLRDFDTPRLRDHELQLRNLIAQVLALHPGIEIDIDVRAQYRNLADGLQREPRAIACAETAFRRAGHPYQRSIIRGGTDGSRLTEMGLPTPNLSSGQHNPHSHLEWACLDEMAQSVEVLIELVQVWAEQRRVPRS